MCSIPLQVNSYQWGLFSHIVWPVSSEQPVPAMCPVSMLGWGTVLTPATVCGRCHGRVSFIWPPKIGGRIESLTKRQKRLKKTVGDFAVTGLWLCSHRLVILQPQTCDFAATDLWLCNRRLSLAALIQTKFLAKFRLAVYFDMTRCAGAW